MWQGLLLLIESSIQNPSLELELEFVLFGDRNWYLHHNKCQALPHRSSKIDPERSDDTTIMTQVTSSEEYHPPTLALL